MKRVFWMMAVLGMALCFLSKAFAEDVAWQSDPTGAGGRRQGILINMPTGENLPVTGTVGLSETTRTETAVLLELTTAGTEYSYTLPANTIAYQVVEQSRTKAIRFSHASGGTADGQAYITLLSGEGVGSDAVAGSKVGAKTLYLQDPTNSGTNIFIYYATAGGV